MKILLVEDTIELGELIKDHLEDQGHEVKHVLEAKSALEALGLDDFDLVITDYNMPGMNGLEFYSEVKKAIPNQRVWMASNTWDQRVENQFLQEGGEYFTDKLNIRNWEIQ